MFTSVSVEETRLVIRFSNFLVLGSTMRWPGCCLALVAAVVLLERGGNGLVPTRSISTKQMTFFAFKYVFFIFYK
jgi:hypothetical protein